MYEAYFGAEYLPAWRYRASWANEHFQLTSETVQVKLQRYLQTTYIQYELPEELDIEAAQLSWLTELATRELSGCVKTILVWKYDISTGHPQLNTAAALVEAFRSRTGNAIEIWTDAAHSAENMKT